MHATCPSCGTQGHLSTFFAEDDGKRLAAVLAGMHPELGRATIAYLGLFKPPKTALRMARAARLAAELDALATAGTVCRDERGGVRRACSPQTWALGIEQVLQQRGSLTLPLEGHNYLRAIVFSLADKAEATAERKRETDARAGRQPDVAMAAAAIAAPTRESQLDNHLRWIDQQVHYGLMTEAEAEAERTNARDRHARKTGT